MPTETSISILSRRFFSDTELQSNHGKQGADSECDLLTFLAVSQSMQVDILPITWQVTRDIVGKGGTSRINEAAINVQTSFAFKCVSNKQKRETPKARIFQTLIIEVTVLSHHLLREHPHIVELQGICWDVPADDEVWPVLVFEKTHFGDLYNFLRLPVGRAFSIAERLKLCVDVATAIIDMHALGRIGRS
jgi:hypothetical protein